MYSSLSWVDVDGDAAAVAAAPISGGGLAGATPAPPNVIRFFDPRADVVEI